MAKIKINRFAHIRIIVMHIYNAPDPDPKICSNRYNGSENTTNDDFQY